MVIWRLWPHKWTDLYQNWTQTSYDKSPDDTFLFFENSHFLSLFFKKNALFGLTKASCFMGSSLQATKIVRFLPNLVQSCLGGVSRMPFQDFSIFAFSGFFCVFFHIFRAFLGFLGNLRCTPCGVSTSIRTFQGSQFLTIQGIFCVCSLKKWKKSMLKNVKNAVFNV